MRRSGACIVCGLTLHGKRRASFQRHCAWITDHIDTVTAQTQVTHVFRSVKRVCRGKTITLIVVEYTDRAIRFGFCYLETLLERKGRRFEVANPAENDRKDLLADLVSIIFTFAARLYGQRRARRKTAAVVIQLHSEGGEEA